MHAGQEGRAVEELEKDKKLWWTPQAILDNNTVFDKGEVFFGKTLYWAQIGKTIQKNRDGRAMLAAMILGGLGPDALDARHRANTRTMEI